MLARAGFGWHLRQAEASDASALLPASKPYLRLHEVRGFTRAEAHDYLTRVEMLNLDEATESEILQLSPAVDNPASVDRDQPAEHPDEPRFNPFDLSLYAGWVSQLGRDSFGKIDPADLGVYVERRIIGRLGSDAEALLRLAIRVLPERTTFVGLPRPLTVSSVPFREATLPNAAAKFAGRWREGAFPFRFWGGRSSRSTATCIRSCEATSMTRGGKIFATRRPVWRGRCSPSSQN